MADIRIPRPVTFDFSRFTPKVTRSKRSVHDFRRNPSSGAQFAESIFLPLNLDFARSHRLPSHQHCKKYFRDDEGIWIDSFNCSQAKSEKMPEGCRHSKPAGAEHFPKFFPAERKLITKNKTRTMRSTEWLPVSCFLLGRFAPGRKHATGSHR